MEKRTITSEGAISKRGRQTADLTGLICSNLDINAMRRVAYKVKCGSGDFTDILDELFDAVKQALLSNEQHVLGKMSAEDLEEMWEEGKDCMKIQIEDRLRVIATKGVIHCCGIKRNAKDQKEYIAGLFTHLSLDEMTTTLKIIQSGRFFLKDLQFLAEVKA